MTQVRTVRGKWSNIARELYGTGDHPRHYSARYRTLTSAELLLARHMARDIKCRYADIAKALNWTGNLHNLTMKLNKVNIRCCGGKLYTNLMRVDSIR